MAKITMQEARRFLWAFPLVAGTAWLGMLLTLLTYWVASGRPRLPLQSNPYIAYISDIGAFHLKPLFIAGCTVTALGYVGTIFSVHYARYDSHMYAVTDVRWRKITSVLAVVSGLIACVALLLLTIFDTYRFSTVHSKLLFICFGGLGVSMVTTSTVWFDQTWKSSRFDNLRRWCILNNFIVLVDVLVGISFTMLMWTNHLRTAGILEWILTFTGGFYLLCFVGYLWKAPGTTVGTGWNDERRPLLV